MDSRAIVGRDGEQRRLRELIAAATGQSLLLRGDSGVGKSALLDYAAESAVEAGCAVIRATGVEAESELPYAGLHQLVCPLLRADDVLDPDTRAVLDIVFGQHPGEPPSIMTLGIAVLNLLVQAGADRPLLLILDDGHWFDEASVQVCGFVARRLPGTRTKLLIAVRTGEMSEFDHAGLPEAAVSALSATASARLLDERFPGLELWKHRRVLDYAQGNPLALLELSSMLAERSFDAGDTLTEPLVPMSHRLQRLFGARIATLAEPVRRQLLEGALDGVGARHGTRIGTRFRLPEVEPAVAVGLLEHDSRSGTIIFRHPLVRSAIVQMAAPDQRRAAHAELARIHHDDIERRARHLAAATIDPDERVAAVLDAAAASATRRGGSRAAVTWLTRAADLSESPRDRSRRLAEAAYLATQAAQVGQAQEILRFDQRPGADHSPGAVIAAGYRMLNTDGDIRSAYRLVFTAIEMRTGEAAESAETMRWLIILLMSVCSFAGDAESWKRARRLLDTLGELVLPRTALLCDTWSDVVRYGTGRAEQVEQAISRHAQLVAWEVTELAVSAHHLDILTAHRPLLLGLVDREIETGAAASGIVMLQMILSDQITTGEWDDAERTAQRVLDHAAEVGYELHIYQAQGNQAYLAALRGQGERARELRARVDAWGRPRGVGRITQIADAVAVMTALGEGDFEAAYAHAVAITPPGEFAPYNQYASRILLDLVEAAVHTGRVEQARAHARAAWDAGLPDISPRLAILTYGASSMSAAADDTAAEMLALVENHCAAEQFPFEVARIRLAYGTRLRHRRGRTAARTHLAAAAETFERLGAPTWAQRAQDELRATGVDVRAAAGRGSATETTVLTSQERRIAELAAGGLTNREIGQQLYLSPRTVSTHLYRIFPKLGIKSRAALRDALTEEPG
ncbi:helix-turn-helix transcriptional regulator [Nocardia macrotermitis]|uniref:HTH luxR-type domain-containing protein n=1 Tax=Nocardia macrotermitis TaxID=2585198 RepID=A0A7K0DD08_9NOCA|nr:AAA family ATPase [Nocardia macrotermitis]MQY23670.1 hypothetical protein [Nocardia macrotermitis]